MSEFWKSVLTAFGMAAKDASPEELDTMVATTAGVLDAAPKAAEPEQKPTGDACAEDEMVEKAPKGDDLGTKLDKILEILTHKEEKKLHDEKSLDEAIEKLGGGKEDEDKSKTIQADKSCDTDPAAKDAAVSLLRTMRPIVAGIKDAQERSRVVDALLESIKGPDMAAQLMAATRANAQQANDAAQTSTFEARCRESEAAYAARNPHKKKED